MSGFEKLNEFWEELKKRKVVRALIFYADEVYQPWVDDAYQRLSILVGRPEQELRGNIDQLEN